MINALRASRCRASSVIDIATDSCGSAAPCKCAFASRGDSEERIGTRSSAALRDASTPVTAPETSSQHAAVCQRGRNSRSVFKVSTQVGAVHGVFPASDLKETRFLLLQATQLVRINQSRIQSDLVREIKPDFTLRCVSEQDGEWEWMWIADEFVPDPQQILAPLLFQRTHRVEAGMHAQEPTTSILHLQRQQELQMARRQLARRRSVTRQPIAAQSGVAAVERERVAETTPASQEAEKHVFVIALQKNAVGSLVLQTNETVDHTSRCRPAGDVVGETDDGDRKSGVQRVE